MAKCLKSESVSRGQKIVTSYARDNSNYKSNGMKNGDMAGSTTNLAHSITGASAHMDGSGHNKKNRFD